MAVTVETTTNASPASSPVACPSPSLRTIDPTPFCRAIPGRLGARRARARPTRHTSSEPRCAVAGRERRSCCAARARTSSSSGTGCTCVLHRTRSASCDVLADTSPRDGSTGPPSSAWLLPGSATSPRRVRAGLNTLLRTHQLVNRHLVPFDHGTMAHGIECRVPYLDREVARWIATVPESARTVGNTAKVCYVSSHPIFSSPRYRSLVLDRQPSALPAAMGPARTALVDGLRTAPDPRCLPRGRLARFANTPEELFWLAAVEAVFLRHRARIDGMDFDALEAEILHAAG